VADTSELAVTPLGEASAAAAPRSVGIAWDRVGPRLEPFLIPLGALFVSLFVFAGFVALAGHDPLDVYLEMYRGAFGTWFSF